LSQNGYGQVRKILLSSNLGQTNRGRQGEGPGRRGNKYFTSKLQPTDHKHLCCTCISASPGLSRPRLKKTTTDFRAYENTPDAAPIHQITFLILLAFSLGIYLSPFLPYQHPQNGSWLTERALCIIFCMREEVWISNVFRIPLNPHRPSKRRQN